MIKNSLPQDYLAVSGFKSMIRENATFQGSGTATDDTPLTWLLTAPATRVTGLSVGAGGAIATGDVVIGLERIRDGAVTSLLTAPITLNSSNITSGDVFDFSSSIDQTKDVKASDRLRLTRTPTAPTNTSTLFVVQCSANGDN